MKQSWELWWFLTAWLSGWVVCIGELFSQDGNSHPCPTFLCAVQTRQTVLYSDYSQKHHGTRFCIGFRFCPFSSIGARPKLTKRNSMDSVELWKFSTVKVSPYRLAQHRGGYWTLCHRMLFHCRMVRTKTLRAYPGETRVSLHSRAKGKAILTVSRRTRGRGWTRL